MRVSPCRGGWGRRGDVCCTNRPIVRREIGATPPALPGGREGPGWSVLEHDVAVMREMRIELHPRQRSPQAALRNRNSSFVLDGEAVLLGVDGRSDFDALYSRRHDAEVEFYAFDILVSDGEDLRGLPLSMRKASLSRLLARRVDGIFLSDFEQGEIGPDLFRHACLMGLEGIVSKHRDRPFSALGQSQEPQVSRNAARYGHVLLTMGTISNYRLDRCRRP